VAVWRPSNGTFYIIPSSTPGTPIQKQFGLPGDIPLPANYDLNTAGKTGYGVFRPSESNMYFQLASKPNPFSQPWGPPNGGPPTNLVPNQIALCSVGKSIYVRVEGDFDGDGFPDFAFWRPSDGIWYIVPSGNPTQSFEQQWGLPGDIPVAADFDGDGKTDIAVWRPGNGVFYVIPSNGPAPTFVNPAAAYTIQWGLPGDIPQPGKYHTGTDKLTDFAVWRPSNGVWYASLSTGTSTPGTPLTLQFGLPGDVPVAGDFDGDGQTDVAVWRPSSGVWYVRQSSTGTTVTTQWGAQGDLPVAADFTGDHRADYALWRASAASWEIMPSSGGNAITIPLGVAQNNEIYAQPPLTTGFITPDLREQPAGVFAGSAAGPPIACEAH
jgi:hypothetical protein